MDPLTERARLAVLLAQQEARSQGSPVVTTLHLLAGLLREDEGIAAELLTNHGVRLERVREVLGAPGPTHEGEAPLSATTSRVIERAEQEARWGEREHVATEHLLLGLLHEDDGEAIRLLLDAGVSEIAIRDELAHRFRRRR